MQKESPSALDTQIARERYQNVMLRERQILIKTNLLAKVRAYSLQVGLFLIAISAGLVSAQRPSLGRSVVSISPASSNECCENIGPTQNGLGDLGQPKVTVALANGLVNQAPNVDLELMIGSSPEQPSIAAVTEKVQPEVVEKALLVVVYSTTSPLDANRHARRLEALSLPTRLSNPRVAQSNSGYYGVVFGNFSLQEAHEVQQTAKHQGLAADAYVMNVSRVTKWFEADGS